MGELEKVDISELDNLGIEVHDLHLVIPPDLPSTTIARVGQGLLAFGERWQWYFIDCYIALQQLEGQEAATQYLTSHHYSYGTMHNYLSYGSKVAIEARSLDIGFTLYEHISKLPAEEQKEWVDKARPDSEGEYAGMSRDELGERIKTRLNEINASGNGKQVEHVPRTRIRYRPCIRCANCKDCHGTHVIEEEVIE